MKRMYANEELVKLIQENAPETEVDDALSNTSENPVQNKVIYGALEEKQDLLPTTVANKYLKESKRSFGLFLITITSFLWSVQSTQR